MKKIFNVNFILLLIVLFSLNSKSVEASDHLAFQKMQIYGGKLLQDYTAEEMDEELEKVGGRQFWGWETQELAVAAKTYFTSHTIFSYYNTGTTKIDYKYQSTVTSTKKVSFSASGNIKYSLSGTKSGFKNGLDASLKLDYEQDDTVVEKEFIEIDFSCDPNTKVIMYVAGEGALYNGVAKRYCFWTLDKEGGYEYFITSTMYQVLEKVAL